MFDFEQLPYAYGKPLATGSLKTSPEDFKVNELLGFELSGEGEHLYLKIEKKGLNTEEVVKNLAKTLGKSEKTISYAGLKDRQALTTQWFSIHCPGEVIAGTETLAGHGWRVIESKRHLKKLKKGVLAANQFSLILRDISDKMTVEKRLEQIKARGVPNYFGLQRFGHEGQNLSKAKSLLLENVKVKNRFLKGIYYSAARAFLFNQILARRVQKANWNQALNGDVMQLSGSNSMFTVEKPDLIISQRLSEFDISPAAPLWGKGAEKAVSDALTIQEEVLNDFQDWCRALEQQGLERAYRPLILSVADLNWYWDEQNLSLEFSLVAGSYATSVVRELINSNAHDKNINV